MRFKRVLLYNLIFVFIFACSSGKSVKMPFYKAAPDQKIDIEPLEKFFRLLEDDLKNARDIVYEKSILRNLSHLQYMNSGGRRYYLLEREAISALLESVTLGAYEDFIVINEHGRIIYTKKNNDIFGKNVYRDLRNSPYERCLINIDREIYIDDVSKASLVSDDYSIFLSAKVEKSRGMEGVIILELGISKIEEIMPDSSFIIDKEGIFKITVDRNRIDTEFTDKSIILNNLRYYPGEAGGFRDSSSRIYRYSYFNYYNLDWVVVSKQIGS